MAYKTIEEFTAHYGYGPQEYFNRAVKADADKAAVDKLAAALKAAEAEAATHKGWQSSNDQAVLQAGAAADNLVQAAKEQLNAATYHFGPATDFLAGKLADYGPYLSTEGQALRKLGWIDTTVVPS